MKNRIIEIVKRIFCLPPVSTLMIAIPSFVFVIAALAGQITSPVLKYISYLLSAYALVISVIGITKIIHFVKGGFRENERVKTALVSIFSLETAMLAEFGKENDEQFRLIMTSLTGAGVSLIVIGMAVFMIIRSGILIKRCTID